MYEINGWSKMYAEDSFEEGEIGQTSSYDPETDPAQLHRTGGSDRVERRVEHGRGGLGRRQEVFGDDRFFGDTIPALLEKVKKFFGVDDDAISMGEIEPDRLDIQRHETDEGEEPSPRELAEWKKGRLKLWTADYMMTVEQITRTPVDLKHFDWRQASRVTRPQTVPTLESAHRAGTPPPWIQEILDAYSDSNKESTAERNLDFRGSRPIKPQEWADAMVRALGGEKGGYNEFTPAVARKLAASYADYMFVAARESSVCVYIQPMAPKRFSVKMDSAASRQIARAFKADEVSSTNSGELRIWWD